MIYQTAAESEAEASRRNERLFAHYGRGEGWTEIVDNGFGKTYRSADERQYALWSYATSRPSARWTPTKVKW
ncbi:hypothetical protein [Streptomyces sp. CB09001]|uniref:hypothetical protein n=1 Tax=Streptomyces sp. CB09001 TaxID=2083284 RepID=UPI001F07F878|nr:hypothetical protein [Streptomyces sp. CB09001]